ncbi:MAG: methyltransferase domain-containing protein [Candidatus Dadabacteria bacterium]|nr:MAG: methyltransferase domain-containing protein [Candidatus Dadabacteria bacterium]
MIKERLVFFREFLTDFQSTGSCFPSSVWAARELIEPLMDKTREPKRILEVGPGSGPVTVEILKNMQDGDTLALCEINPRLMKTLKEKLEKNCDFQKRRDSVTFHQCAIQDFPEGQQFDLIVCAIPFLNLDRPTVEEIFKKLSNLCAPGGILTYFEYIGIRVVSKMVSPPERKRRIRELDSFFRKIYSQNLIERKHVWLNVLPINVYKLKLQNAQV